MSSNIIHRDPAFAGAVAKTTAGYASPPISAPSASGSDPISVASAAVLAEWHVEDSAGLAGIQAMAAGLQGKAQNTDDAITERDETNADSFAAIEVKNV